MISTQPAAITGAPAGATQRRFSAGGVWALVQASLATNRWLTLFGLAMLGLFLVTLVGIVADPRVITGAPAWVKPAKFAISLTIYSFTLVWLLSFITGHRRLVGVIAAGTALGFTVEMVIVVMQVLRGTTSHFNTSTPLDAILYRIMGGVIMVIWFLTLATAVLLCRGQMADRVLAWSLRLGIIIALVGMGVAFLMTIPNAAQMAVLQAGGAVATEGAHSVGVADGGPGLPFLGWSTVGGDLRIPHFFGLHGLQVLPFLGWLLGRRRFAGLREGARVALVAITGAGYLGLIALLTWQALRGQSIIAPDALTLQAAAALVGATALAVLVTVLAGRSQALTRPVQAAG